MGTILKNNGKSEQGIIEFPHYNQPWTNQRFIYFFAPEDLEDGKAKAFDDINISKFFSDCDKVVEKYKNGEYTKKPVKGLKTAIQQSALRGDALAAAASEIITDYYMECNSQK